MKKSVFSIIIFLSAILCCNAEDYVDVIYLKDGTHIEGYIIEHIPEKSYTLKKINGDIVIIDFEKVERTRKKDKSNANYYDIDFWEAGVNLGSPGAINLLVDRWFSPIGVKVSGIYIGRMYGFQGNLMYKLSDTYSSCHSLGFVFGMEFAEFKQDYGWYKKIDIYDWKYFGIAYNLNWYGFWFEFGLSKGEGRPLTSDSIMPFHPLI
ncbi:MAG: hypothetical protein V1779_10135 [bacterium]